MSNADIAPMLIVLFIGSVARVLLAVVQHEAFGVEPTLALACLFVIPVCLYRGSRSIREA